MASWNQSSRMAFGITKGLSYLDKESTTQVIHCDIKRKNEDTILFKLVTIFDMYRQMFHFWLCTNSASASQHCLRHPTGHRPPPLDLGSKKQIKKRQNSRSQKRRRNDEWAKVRLFGRNSSKDGTIRVFHLSLGLQLPGIDNIIDIGTQTNPQAREATKPRSTKGKLEALVDNDSEALNDMKILERFIMVEIYCIQENPCLRPSMRWLVKCLKELLKLHNLRSCICD
ncbi:hypothetical protein LguiA_021977 [Lonicera macranthoides]